jgi:hypothetical protein
MEQKQVNSKKEAPERKLRVSSVNQSSGGVLPQQVPSIRLSGKWVEQSGFGIGHRFIVRVSPGKLELVAEWRDQLDRPMRRTADERMEGDIAVSDESGMEYRDSLGRKGV